MDETKGRVYRLDARTLRAIAHPLRMRMLGILRIEGPATATGLAARVGESSGTTSWHLRQLAEHGFIEEDTERGNRRERWWRASHEYTNVEFADFVDDPDSAGALNVFMLEALNFYYRNATTFIAHTQTWSREWVDAATLSDDYLPLTAEELARLRAELWAVVRRHKREHRPGDELVAVQLQLFPTRRLP